MSGERWPNIRVYSEKGFLVLRDGLRITLYSRQPHAQIASGAQRALELYLEKVSRAGANRYPGMDIPPSRLPTLEIGTKVDGVHWLNFLGPPVMEELGGVSGLLARLHSPTTTVQEMDGGRAVVILGEWPDAGDLEQGRTLPAYRELARVLEPFRYQGRYFPNEEVPEELRRWERRFLDGA